MCGSPQVQCFFDMHIPFSSFSSLPITLRQRRSVLGREEKLIDTEEKLPAEKKNAWQTIHALWRRNILHREEKCSSCKKPLGRAEETSHQGLKMLRRKEKSAVALCTSQKHCTFGPLLKKCIIMIFSIRTGSLLQYTLDLDLEFVY